MNPTVLTIAGSDPSCGAGMPADLATFLALGCCPLAALTAVVVQNSRRVSSLQPIDVAEQIAIACEEREPDVIKVGALCSDANITAAVKALREKRCPIVVDPVLVASVGAVLLPAASVATLRDDLLPLATLITPNLEEASTLLGRKVCDLDSAAHELCNLGIHAVLVTGGEQACDYLAQGSAGAWFRAEPLPLENEHGTGCVLSAAIAAYLAHGASLSQAVASAKTFLAQTRRKRDEREDNTTTQLGCQSLPHADLHRPDARLL